MFNKQEIETAIQKPDIAKLQEINRHELLQPDGVHTEAKGNQTFEQIQAAGVWFLQQTFDSYISVNKLQQTPPIFLAKLMLGKNPQEHFPCTVVTRPNGLEFSVVPIPFAVFERAQFQTHDESLVALASAAVIAPQAISALEAGIKTTHCASKKETLTALTPDHGAPIAVLFDTARNKQKGVLSAAHTVTQNQDLTIRATAHLHGLNAEKSTHITQSAMRSGISAGVEIISLRQSELPKKALLAVQTRQNPLTGNKEILPFGSQLAELGTTLDLPFLATVVGAAIHFVGNPKIERALESVFSPEKADTPMREIVIATR